MRYSDVHRIVCCVEGARKRPVAFDHRGEPSLGTKKGGARVTASGRAAPGTFLGGPLPPEFDVDELETLSGYLCALCDHPCDDLDSCGSHFSEYRCTRPTRIKRAGFILQHEERDRSEAEELQSPSPNVIPLRPNG